ncbi:hypothetical protein ACSVDE_09705 [Pseudalkalibacillus sp. Hm43]|uniref:hypothetical protein n=1 Tax=Pseudalkalibacillus sp. Hm43 TaxID=3450742 RepID=UPI003F43A1F8
MFNSGLRGFGAGLIVAAGILALVHYQGSDNQEVKAEGSESITYEEVKTYLKNEGLVAVEEAQFEQLQAAQTGEKKPSEDTKEKSEEEAKEEQVHSTTLVIQKGTSTGEVTNFLENQKIIKSSDELLNYLRSNNMESKVRFGNYEVNSNMSIAEIAKTITSP